MSYTLLSYGPDPRHARAGVRIGDATYNAAALLGRPDWSTTLAILDDWAEAGPALEAAARAPGVAPLAGAPLLAPLLYPGHIYAAGANYHDHIAEMERVLPEAPRFDPRANGGEPWHFVKPVRATVIGDGATMIRPGFTRALDWEIELAAVIGREGQDIPEAEALSYVAGYTIANDLSARDAIVRANVPPGAPFRYDWISIKGFAGACPMGPWITPASAIPDPQALGLKLWVNDALEQDSSTAQMIFSLAEQIAYLSTRTRLYPGDVILTGTPAGVGMAKRRYLQPGDRVRLQIEGIGTLTHHIG